MNITEQIHNLVDFYISDGYVANTQEINCGFCVDFANDVVRSLGYNPKQALHKIYKSCYIMCPEDFHIVDRLPVHWWVWYKGLHYDAEVPNGVKHWLDLPFYQRIYHDNFRPHQSVIYFLREKTDENGFFVSLPGT